MNVFLFAMLAWVALGLEIALPPVLDAGAAGVQPSFLVPLLVFVALHTEPRPALWAGLVLGLLVDLVHPLALVDGGGVTIPGPHALGFMLAARLTLSIRGVVIRRNPVTLVILSVLAAAVAETVVVACMTLRSAFDGAVVWGGFGELFPGLLSALYTGLAALVLSFPLFALTPFFGFPPLHAPRFARRD